MKPVVASEVNFVRKVLIEAGGNPSNYLKFMLLPNEFGDILNSIANPSSTEGQILSGLLNAKIINVINALDMTKNINPNLIDIDPRYIELSLMCGRNFVHFIEISQHNENEFVKYNITTHHGNNINYNSILEEHNSNVVKSWNLQDGDVQKISDHISSYLNHIVSVKIYDRYFSAHSLASLAELFSRYAGIFGKFPGSLDIYVGKGMVGGLTAQDVISRLSSFVDGTKLSVMTCDRVSSGNLHIHDRVMQLDNDYTFEFTAGLGCYFENNGKNRTSTIHLRSIIPDYAEFEIKDQFSNIVKFRF